MACLGAECHTVVILACVRLRIGIQADCVRVRSHGGAKLLVLFAAFVCFVSKIPELRRQIAGVGLKATLAITRASDIATVIFTPLSRGR